MFEIKLAVRQGTPILIGLWGPSNSGKTYSALLIARGLAGPEGQIVLIDTENGRARNYADLVGGWQHLDLQPPFTPPRYSEAMADAEGFGARVIIFDSGSHVWEGEGGVLDMADQSTGKALNKWRVPKMAYKRMMNALLRSNVHVIFCLRAKEKFVQTGSGDNLVIASVGLVPIAEKNLIYEMTLAVRLDEARRGVPVDPVKAPEELAAVVKAGQILTVETGEKIAEWISGGVPIDKEIEALKRQGRDKAPQGTTVMRDWWQDLTKEQRQALEPILEELRLTAAQADTSRAEEAREESAQANGGDGRDPLADAFTTAPEASAEAANGGPDSPTDSPAQERHPIEAG